MPTAKPTRLQVPAEKEKSELVHSGLEKFSYVQQCFNINNFQPFSLTLHTSPEKNVLLKSLKSLKMQKKTPDDPKSPKMPKLLNVAQTFGEHFGKK